MSHKLFARYLLVLLSIPLLLLSCCEDEDAPITPECEVTVSLPNGDVTWKTGQTYNITWTSTGPCGSQVGLELYREGELCRTIVDTLSNVTTYAWTCAMCNLDTTGYVVRVTDLGSGAYDESDATFTISNTSGAAIEIPDPPTGTQTEGEDLEITWESSAMTGTIVMIELLCDGAPCDTLAETDNDGSFTWAVAPVGSAACGYALRISDPTSGATTTMAGTFCIRPPGYLAVTYPNGGEALLVGTAYNLTWVAPAGSTNRVKIELVHGPDVCATIATSTDNDGSFNWTAVQCEDLWSPYYIRITNLDTGDVDASDNPFGIYATSLTVTAPELGDQWVEGTEHDITWTKHGEAGERASITLYVDGDSCAIIAADILNAGTYTWEAMRCEEGADGSNYAIKVTDLEYGAYDMSATFSIPAPILDVNSPAAGAAWNDGEEYTITWDYTGPAELQEVMIELLFDGTIVDTIASAADNNGSYTWTAEKAGSGSCPYTIEITGTTVDVSGASDEFCIYTPALTVLTPNGNETWIGGGTYAITWDQIGTAGDSVKIELLKAGTVCATIAEGTDNYGTYDWVAEQCGDDSTLYAVQVTDLTTLATDVSDATFKIRPFEFALLSPNGGEEWIEGVEQTISWSRTEGASGDSVKIELMHGGEVVTTISAGTDNNRAFVWTPAQYSGEVTGYSIVVTDLTTLDADESDATFSILDPVIEITSPAGDEEWIEGTAQSITWEITGTAGAKAKIELLAAGSACATIADSTTNDGTYEWTVADCGAETSGLAIQITDLTTLATAVSDTFAVLPPVLTVTAPNGAESWDEGTAYDITWSTVGTAGATVTIELLQNGAACATIATAETNDGSYTWTAAKCSNSSAHYTVRVTDDETAATDVSDAAFTIPPDNAITVTAPNGGEEWVAGSTQTITWSQTGTVGDSVKIELVRASAVCATISPGTDNEGTYEWIVARCESYETGYAIRITDLTVGASDESNETFSITAPALEVTAPNGGESWYEDTAYNITWTTASTGEDSVKIELMRLGALVATISAGTQNDSSFSWTAVQYDDDPNDYIIRVTNLATLVYDESDAVFSIPGRLTVTAPVGGETWYVGSDHAITWTQSTSQGAEVMIEQLLDGAPCDTIAATATNNGAYTWQSIAQCGSESEGYTVRITDLTNGAVGVSDSSFVISAPTLTVTAPDGGERWLEGSTHSITWTTNGTVGANVKIDLLLDGALDSQIVASTTNSGAYSWSGVAHTGADSCGYTVRITDLSDTTLVDVSDTTFCIPPSVAVTAPVADARLLEGATYTLTWTYSASTGDSVQLSLLQPAAACTTAIGTVENDGSASWTAEACSPDTTGYFLKVYDPTTGASALSDSFKVIPNITVTTPDGGESWSEGVAYQIEWDYSSQGTGVGGNVLIELILVDTVVDTIATAAPNDGQHPWTAVRHGATPGYKVRITGNASGVSDESDAAFDIAP